MLCWCKVIPLKYGFLWQCGCADICTAQCNCFLPMCFCTFFGGISWLTLWRCYFISCRMFILHTHRVPHFWSLLLVRSVDQCQLPHKLLPGEFLCFYLFVILNSYYFACLFSCCTVPHFWSLLPVRPQGPIPGTSWASPCFCFLFLQIRHIWTCW